MQNSEMTNAARASEKVRIGYGPWDKDGSDNYRQEGAATFIRMSGIAPDWRQLAVPGPSARAMSIDANRGSFHSFE